MKYSIRIAVSIASVNAAAAASIVDFEQAPGDSNPIYEFVTYADSSGFNFDGAHFHTMDDDLGGLLVSNDSRVYLGHEGANFGRAVTMTKADGGTFSVHSFDAAEAWIGDNGSFPNAWGIHVTGYFNGGGSINTIVQLDGIADGGSDDWESFQLTGFTNLIAFEFNGVEATGAPDRAFGIDNINTIPTPGALVLFGLGGLSVSRRR